MTRTIPFAVIATLLGLFLRILFLVHEPLGLNRDEAALGFNAWSIHQTGTDEWGKKMPLTFRSFGDIKLPGYIYTLSILFSVFPYDSLTIRLPSLLAGLALIPLTYYFVLKVTKNKYWALGSAMTLAVSPWAIHYSTVAYEANLALCLTIASVYLLWDQKTLWKILLGALLLGISCLTYNAPLIFLVPLLIWLCLRKHVSIKAVVLSCVSLGLAAALTLPATQGKKGITLWQNDAFLEQSRNLHSSLPAPFNTVLANRYIFSLPTIVLNQVRAFSPTFLFSGGSNPWVKQPRFDHFEVFVWFAVMAGLITLIVQVWKHRKNVHHSSITLLGSLFILPLAASITSDAPHVTRSLTLFWALSCIGGCFLVELVQKRLRKNQTKNFLTLVLFILFVFGLGGSLLIKKVIHSQPPELGETWSTGLKEALVQASTIQQQSPYKTITLVGDTHYMYIFPLVYLHLSPKEFQQTVQYYPNDHVGLSQVKQYTSFRFVGDERDVQKPSIVVRYTPDGRVAVTED